MQQNISVSYTTETKPELVFNKSKLSSYGCNIISQQVYMKHQIIPPLFREFFFARSLDFDNWILIVGVLGPPKKIFSLIGVEQHPSAWAYIFPP